MSSCGEFFCATAARKSYQRFSQRMGPLGSACHLPGTCDHPLSRRESMAPTAPEAHFLMVFLQSSPDQSIQVFSMVISLVCVGSVVVTINAKLLGGRVSFFQSLCVLGYCLFPLLVASLVSFVLHNLFVRIPVSIAAWAWSVWGEFKKILPSRRLWTRGTDFVLRRRLFLQPR